MLVDITTRSLPKNLAWEFEKVMVVQKFADGKAGFDLA